MKDFNNKLMELKKPFEKAKTEKRFTRQYSVVANNKLVSLNRKRRIEISATRSIVHNFQQKLVKCTITI